MYSVYDGTHMANFTHVHTTTIFTERRQFLPCVSDSHIIYVLTYTSSMALGNYVSLLDILGSLPSLTHKVCVYFQVT